MRTDAEILNRAAAIKDRDWMGIEGSNLLVRLPFDLVKQFLKDDAEESEWKVWPRDHESMLAEMLEYMPFAWEKANNGRGLSAGRCMSHYAAWIWLAGDDLGDLHDYDYYGKDKLVMICEHYGWDHKQWDDGERSNG